LTLLRPKVSNFAVPAARRPPVRSEFVKIRTALASASALIGLAAAGSALAGTIPYPDAGTPNAVTYTFTASSTGDIVVYFAGSGASYDESIGMLVNGVASGVVGLNDHGSSIGQALDLGHVTAGDTLTFFDIVSTTGNTWYSQQSLNSDGGNHVYSTTAAANQLYAGSPAGIYAGFEDIAFNANSDFNYFDDTFIFTNTTVTSSVPEPAGWSMMLLGVAGVGGLIRRRNRVAAAA
jgi:hypothetical protein